MTYTSAVTSSIFLPSIDRMSQDLHTTPSVIDYTVSIFLVTIGAAPLVWSPLSTFYGRKPMYLVSMPIHVGASIGVALSKNVGAIIGTRIVQGIGGSAVLAVGAGSVGDLFRWVHSSVCCSLQTHGARECYELVLPWSGFLAKRGVSSL